ncbi:MAG: site-specific integrase [Opitutae bacterium]|nr:site-specific integrase [Opitutae bacterium]
MPEEILHDVEGVFDERAHRGLGFFQRLDEPSRCAARVSGGGVGESLHEWDGEGQRGGGQGWCVGRCGEAGSRGMPKSKTTGKDSVHASTRRGADKKMHAPDCESLVRFAETMRLRSLADATRDEYLRFVRKLATRHGGDPATLDESQVRAHLLRLKDEHHYSPSSMRTAVSAMRAFYGLHLGRDWKLFDLVRSPSAQKLPVVLTREEVARLFATVHVPRFRTLFRLIYACGLRIGEAVNLEVRDLREPGRVHIREAKGNKERCVPLPEAMRAELRAWWKTHRHPRWLFVPSPPASGHPAQSPLRFAPGPNLRFDHLRASALRPGVGRGWREQPERLAQLGAAVEPMGVGSVQHCLRLARAEARLPEGTVVHTLRHSYATHLLEEGVSIRLISAYLGHASLETTLIYTHLTAVNEESARAAVARLIAPHVARPPESRS